MLLNELFEETGKTVAVTFGRLNPPTIGHQKLVDAVLKQKADAHFLFVSQTHQPTGKNKTRLSNPLPFDVKLGFIQKAFPNINIGNTSVSTAIGMLQFLEKQGFENVIFVGGSDRVSDFDALFNKQNGVDYNFKSIKVVSSGARDPDAEGAEGMSASKMRAAAISNDFKSFQTGLPSGLQGNAKEVFSAVRQGLDPWLEETVAAKLNPVNWLNHALDKAQGSKSDTRAFAKLKGNDTYIDAFDDERDVETDREVDESPIEMDPSEPMNPMIYGHNKANPAKLKYRMLRASGQLKDLAARAENASPAEWQLMARQFDELKMNMEQIRHALDELAKVKSKGGIRSRGITV